MKSKSSLISLIPIFLGFYVAGFVYFSGFVASYVRQAFRVDDLLAALLPAVAFAFFLLTLPVALLARRAGIRKTLLGGLLFTLAGLLVPLFLYSFPGFLLAFGLIGMGNVLLQVSLLPLFAYSFSGTFSSAPFTAGRMIQALSALCGPFMAAFALCFWGRWQYLFAVFAIVTLVTVVWLVLLAVSSGFSSFSASDSHSFVSGFRSTFHLLKNTSFAWLFGMAAIATGLDVGMNLLIPELLMEYCGYTVADAALGSSVYFAFRMLGVFVGTMLLPLLSGKRVLHIYACCVLAALFLLLFVRGEYPMLLLSGMVGFCCTSFFPLFCNMAMHGSSNRESEVAVLMSTAICGGALIPVCMGILSVCIGSSSGALLILLLCALGLAAGILFRIFR